MVETNRDLAEELTKDLVAFECSPVGRERAEAFKQEMQNEKHLAEREVLALLQRRDLSGASLREAQYQAVQVFNGAMGVDWKNFKPDHDVAFLKAIFEGRPLMLSKIQDELLDKLRLTAGMMYLCGSNSAKELFDQMPETGIHLDALACSQMLVRFGFHKRDISGYHDSDVRVVEILGCKDKSCCPHCSAIAGKRYLLAEVPELPLPCCTSKNGCRCTTVFADF